MSLTESKFRSIMSALRSDTNKADEKRRAPRVGVGIRGLVLVHSTRKVYPVSIRDLSMGGIGLTCEQRLAAGEHISLVLTKADGKSTHILYEVRHCHEAINGIFDVGAKLVEVAATTPAPAPAQAQPTVEQTSARQAVAPA
ncbi:MAG TPA: PilZ domain-containing protein [Tepidisphaeraceae bacterium]|jgi:hypothetical protein